MGQRPSDAKSSLARGNPSALVPRGTVGVGNTMLFLANRLSVLCYRLFREAQGGRLHRGLSLRASTCPCSTWNIEKKGTQIKRVLTFHVEQIAREETKTVTRYVSKEVSA